eukprot:SAG11_NODE_32_length_22830_cov_17.507941_19_plen_95_part_00
MTEARIVNGPRVPGFYSWSSRVQPTMYLSLFINIILCISLDKRPLIDGAGSDGTEESREYQAQEFHGFSSLSSLERATFGRWVALWPELIPRTD